MEENIKKNTLESEQEPAGKSLFNFQTIYMTLILNWKWFALSLIICLGLASIYLRYTTPIYQAYAKLLIKEENNTRGRNSLQYATNLGMVSNSTGIDNEMEILKSSSIAIQAVKDLKLYTTYMSSGKVTNRLIYKNQPITVDIDPMHLDMLNYPITLTITREGKKYHVEGTYYSTNSEAPGKSYAIDKSFTALPAAIGTQTGILTFIPNSTTPMQEGEKMLVRISPPKTVAVRYAAGLSIAQSSKSTSIAVLTINDQSPERAKDYLRQLAICYNRQANEDKNEVAVRTEEFINGRLEKINTELGSTESQLESYKKANKMVELQMSANQAISNSDQYDQKLAEANTQIALLNSITDYMNEPSHKYETLPANIGISDQSAVSLINKYNEIVLERNRLLRSASENSPTVTPLTSQLDDLSSSIRRAMAQAKRSMDIQRNAVASQYGKYNSMIQQTPEQEKTMKQIGRQLEVKAGLYLMLLQKREENSISLAATADKGKLIDDPALVGKVAPQSTTIYMGGIAAALAIPSIVFFLIGFFRYN